MKTIKFALLLALLVSPIVIFSNFRPKNEPVLQTTVHADAALSRLRVEVTKPKDAFVTLRLLDADGWPIHEQVLPTQPARVLANLHLCEVPNGTYRLEVDGPGRTEARTLHLADSEHPSQKRRIDVWPAQ